MLAVYYSVRIARYPRLGHLGVESNNANILPMNQIIFHHIIETLMNVINNPSVRTSDQIFREFIWFLLFFPWSRIYQLDEWLRDRSLNAHGRWDSCDKHFKYAAVPIHILHRKEWLTGSDSECEISSTGVLL